MVSKVIEGYDVDTNVYVQFSKEIAVKTVFNILNCLFEDNENYLRGITYDLEKEEVKANIWGGLF